MRLDLRKMTNKNRYEYNRISFNEQVENSSLVAQKEELIKLSVLEENFDLEIGLATDAI